LTGALDTWAIFKSILVYPLVTLPGLDSSLLRRNGRLPELKKIDPNDRVSALGKAKERSFDVIEIVGIGFALALARAAGIENRASSSRLALSPVTDRRHTMRSQPWWLRDRIPDAADHPRRRITDDRRVGHCRSNAETGSRVLRS
jgi:hypothetical protein